MQDQRSARAVGSRDEDEVEFGVLALLLDPGSPGPWSLDELAREVGCGLAATQAVLSLHAAGLAHRCGEFVFATRPASRFGELLRE